MDAVLLDRVAAFDPAGVLAVNASGKGQACGFGAIAATLWTARALGATRARVLNHATSGDATGHFLNVVGYGAAMMLK
jgi:AmmeMemoRadiSam system protein B